MTSPPNLKASFTPGTPATLYVQPPRRTAHADAKPCMALKRSRANRARHHVRRLVRQFELTDLWTGDYAVPREDERLRVDVSRFNRRLRPYFSRRLPVVEHGMGSGHVHVALPASSLAVDLGGMWPHGTLYGPDLDVTRGAAALKRVGNYITRSSTARPAAGIVTWRTAR